MGSMQEKGGHDESVEEAVFKYVGDGLRDGEKGADGDMKKEGEDKNGGGSDMEWFFKQDGSGDRNGQLEKLKHDPKDSQNVAIAAVAAAFAPNRGDHEQSNSSSRKRGHHGKHGDSKMRKLSEKDVAVDPELATLDDDNKLHSDTDVMNHNQHEDGNDEDGEDEHDRLVRKAIIDSHSISQHPDFQQYLNTEDDYGKHDKNDPNVVDLHNKSYAELQKSGHIDDENVDKSLLSKGDYREVLPKVITANELTNFPDVSHLIQSAASKASETLGSSTSQPTGKSFDAQEENALEQFINDYQKIKGLTRKEICERIWSNERRKDDFWVNICKVLPYRTRSSIYKHVRRKYHIFEQRGKWTPAEELELKKLCIEKEGQWSEIGKALGRMPEDCRDRWRNYVKCGDVRSSHKWSPDEENLLKQVISEMIAEAENESNPDNSLVSLEDNQGANHKPRTSKSLREIINWTVVSERMGGKRSRIQCRYKWNKLIKKQAMIRVESIAESDRKWILEKLRDLGFTEDSQVDWNELATLKPDSKWTGTELKLCYEKMRGKIKNAKQRSINEISKELLISFDS